MPRKESPPLSINEAYELSPGDKNNPVWVNNVRGLVLSIKTGRMGAADTWPTVLGNDGGGRSLEVVFWQEPRFTKGDLISLDGGCRRTEFKGVQSISVGQKTEVHVIRKGGNHDALPRDDSRGGGDAEAEARLKAAYERGQGSQQPKTGDRPAGPTGSRTQSINGQTVGMAVKLAGDILIHNALSVTPQEPVDLATLENRLVDVASQIIRASARLEAGQLTSAGEETPY